MSAGLEPNGLQHLRRRLRFEQNDRRAYPELSDAEYVLRTALERIRLHGSPFWNPRWRSPARMAHEALNKADNSSAAVPSRGETP